MTGIVVFILWSVINVCKIRYTLSGIFLPLMHQFGTDGMLTLSLRPPSRNSLINAPNRRGLRVKSVMTKES
jgi:hypothetical protein